MYVSCEDRDDAICIEIILIKFTNWLVPPWQVPQLLDFFSNGIESLQDEAWES